MLALAVLFAAAAYAEEDSGWWGSYYMPGNTIFSGNVGIGFYSGGIGIDVYPAAEVIITKFRPGDLFAIDIGGGARGLLSFWNSGSLPSHGYFGWGAGPFVSAHLGFRGLDFPFSEYLARLDVFTSLGLNYIGYGFSGDWSADTQPTGGLRFGSTSGFNYFLTDNISVSLSYNYLSNWNSTTIGVSFKLGPKEELGERPEFELPDEDVRISVSTFSGDMAYMQFSALYWSILGFGGFIADDASFAEGDGIRWWMSFPEDDDRDEIEYTRSLLRINSDGSKWWRAEFEVDDEVSAFEYLVDMTGALKLLRYEDAETGQVVTHEPSDPDAWWGGYEASVKDREDLEELSVGTERVRVPAGTYTADKVIADEAPYEYIWWFTEDVPGLLVKLEGYEDRDLIVEGELLEVLHDVESPWGAAW